MKHITAFIITILICSTSCAVQESAVILSNPTESPSVVSNIIDVTVTNINIPQSLSVFPTNNVRVFVTNNIPAPVETSSTNSLTVIVQNPEKKCPYSFLAILKDIIVAIAAIVAAVFARKGINTYTNEFAVKDQYELAKRLLYAVYNVRDGFSHVRNAFMSVTEYPKNENGEIITDPQHEAVAYAYKKRWEILANALKEFEVEMTQAQAFWDFDKSTLLGPVRECVISLQIAIENRLDSMRGEEGVYIDNAERATERKVLYGRGDIEKDPFGKKIQQSLEPIESMVKPHLKPTRGSSLLGKRRSPKSKSDSQEAHP
jgi:hypothetical protein